MTKILPLLDAFRNVPMLHGGETEREIKMHSDFNVLVRSITVALQKYGYSEFSPGMYFANFIIFGILSLFIYFDFCF